MEDINKAADLAIPAVKIHNKDSPHPIYTKAMSEEKKTYLTKW